MSINEKKCTHISMDAIKFQRNGQRICRECKKDLDTLIKVTYQPTEYRALYWRSLIGTYVTVGWTTN